MLSANNRTIHLDRTLDVGSVRPDSMVGMAVPQPEVNCDVLPLEIGGSA